MNRDILRALLLTLAAAGIAAVCIPALSSYYHPETGPAPGWHQPRDRAAEQREINRRAVQTERENTDWRNQWWEQQKQDGLGGSRVITGGMRHRDY